jgi:hypothetical protein
VTPLATLVASAQAAEPHNVGDRSAGDTSYGRIDGDISLVGGLGAAVGPGGARAALDLRGRYLDTAGIYATYEDGALFGSNSDPKRVIAFGAEIRPLFLVRWLKGGEIGNARADLAIDSLGLELGTFFEQPAGGSLSERPGFQVGGGLGVPLFARASGLWVDVHAGVRWSDAALAGEALRGPSDRAGFVAFTLAWHQFFGAHVVDLGDGSR